MLTVKQRFIKALKAENVNLLIELAKGLFIAEFDLIKDRQGNHILHIIAKNGSTENLTEILKLKPSVARLINLPNRKGNTPLHTATRFYNRDVIIALTENGAMIAKRNLQGDTSLHIAAAHTNSSAVERLCKAGYLQNREFQSHLVTFDIFAKNKKNQTAKTLAKSIYIIKALEEQAFFYSFQKAIALIYQGNQLALKKCISENAGILSLVDEQGDTLLHHAITAYKQTGKSCLLEVLNAKPNANIKNKDGLTPLLLAATLDFLSVVLGETRIFLIISLKQLGANMQEKDDGGFTALHYAALHDDPTAIDLLINYADIYVDVVNGAGLAPIHMAASFGKKRAFNALLRNGADVNIVAYPYAVKQLFEQPVQTSQEITPLWIALCSSCYEIVNTIFDDYISKKDTETLPDLRALDGSTLLHYFAFTKDFKRFKQALNIGIDPFVQNDSNYLAFHAACAVGDLDIVKHYVEVLAPRQSYWSRLKGCTFDINDIPEKGINALTLVGQNKNIIQYLKRKGAIEAPVNAERTKSTMENMLKFYNSQTDFRGQLESTKMNQVLSLGRIVGSTLLTYTKGTVGMGVAATHQALLYGMPTIIQKSSDLYYYAKPTIHNNAPKCINKSFDATATTTSNVTRGFLKALDWLDIAANPSRRIAGHAASMGMANLASQYTDSRELQGAAYFFGREIGMFAVDAYHHYNQSRSDTSMNEELSKAYNLWCSLLGKEHGERFVSTMHQVTEIHQGLLESVGWFEHTVLSYAGVSLDTVRKAVVGVGLQTLDENIASVLSTVSFYPQTLYSTMQFYSREILQWREQVLTNIEHQIAENLLPDSEHRNVTLQYLLLNQTVLLSQKLIAKKTEQTTQENTVKALEEEHHILDRSATEERSRLETQIEIAKNSLLTMNQECDVLADKVTKSQEAYDVIWQKTPKGALEFTYKEAQRNQFDGQIKIEGLKRRIQFLNDHNAEEITLAEINNQLEEAEKALVDLNNALDVTESDWLKLANPVEKDQLFKNKEDIDKQIIEQISAFKQEQNIVYQKLDNLFVSQDDLIEIWVEQKNTEQKVENAKHNFDVIDLQIKAIDSPPPFNSRNTVEDALAQYPHDCDQVVKLILEKIVATGMINSSDADARMTNSLKNAFSSHRNKFDRLNNVLSHHLNMLREDYRTSLVQLRIQLQKINDTVLSEYEVISEKYDTQRNIVQQNKLAYETAIGGESADGNMIEQVFYQPNNWDMVYNAEGIKTTLILLGQSTMTVNAMVDSGGPSSQWHMAASLAKSLVDYKYLFITAPTIDVRLQEMDALAIDLAKQTLDQNHILVLKQNVDFEIAQQLLDNSKTLEPQLRAASISQYLQNGFRYSEGQTFIFENNDAPLSEMLAARFEAQDDASAAQAITNVLQNQTNAISLEEAGVYVSPEVAPHVPRKPHGLNRWWDHAKEEVTHYGKKILKITGGYSTSIDPNGVSTGFTYGNQFRVIQFTKPKTPPLLTIEQKMPTPVARAEAAVTPSTLDKSFVPYPARVIKDIPHVVVMPWESEIKQPVQPLMFSALAQAASQVTMVQTRSQTRSQLQVQLQAQRTPVFQWEAVQQPILPIRFPVPQNAAFTLRDFKVISSYKQIDVEPSMFKRVVDNTRSAIAFLSDPAKRAEMGMNPADHPMKYAAYLGVCEVEQVNLRLAVYNAVKGLCDNIGGYIGADVYRATHDEQTATAQHIREIGQTISAATEFLSERKNIANVQIATLTYVRDEYGRLVRNESTQTGTAFKNWTYELDQRPADELVTSGMKELIYLVTGEAFLRVVGYSSSQAYKLLKDNPVNIQFFKEYGLKGPLFEPAKLLSFSEVSVYSSKVGVTSQSQITSTSFNAANVNAQAALDTKLKALQRAQRSSVKTQELPDGRIRYYEAERPSRNPGPTRGSSHVTEYNPNTGQVRSWSECYDHQGNVNRINPKMIDGQQIHSHHYPPTQTELTSRSLSKPGGSK